MSDTGPSRRELLTALWRSTREPAADRIRMLKKKWKDRQTGEVKEMPPVAYVGHAQVTDMLLEADPEWNWEPLAVTPDGLPLRDERGGLWIRLTVHGYTRIGYGTADMNKPDAVKELIGDAIRNAALRFGVALALWAPDGLADLEEAPPGAEVTPILSRRLWQDRCAGCGVDERELIQAAHHYAKELGVHVPANLGEINHPGLTAQLIAWMDRKKASRT